MEMNRDPLSCCQTQFTVRLKVGGHCYGLPQQEHTLHRHLVRLTFDHLTPANLYGVTTGLKILGRALSVLH